MTNTATSHTPSNDSPSDVTMQLRWAVFSGFVAPFVVVVALVASAISAGRQQTGADESNQVVLSRIEKIGKVEIRDANREMKTGEQVFAAQCGGCHSSGVAGAPKFGDQVAWSPRIKTGFDSLLNSALKGKNAMAPQGGGAFDNFEIARAVVYMANGSGAKFPEPEKGSATK